MKRSFFYMLLCLFTPVLFTACLKKDLLDATQTTNLNEESVFSDSARTHRFLLQIYNEMGANSYVRRYGSNSIAECSDESTSKLFGGTQSYVIVMLGTLSASMTGPYNAVYVNGYNNIRRVNVFLKNLPRTPLSAEMKTRLKGEVRFLRAWYYWQLLQHFGGVPIIRDSIYTNSDDIRSPRATIAQSVQYLTQELDEARQDLPSPLEQRSEDYGFATKGMCMALKSRLLLYAASPLFNGGAVGSASAAVRPYISYPTADPSRWQLALQAAEEVINSGYYQLVEDNSKPGYGFYKLFITRFNPEYILADMRPANRDMERHFLPASRNGVNNACPSLNMAKLFGTISGKPIMDPTSGYDPKKPFEKRDPRFDYTFINNGSLWRTRSSSTATPVWTYVGAPTDGIDASLVFTGMYFRKFCSEAATGDGGSTSERCLPLLRYAEILLNYAEAANETGNINGAYDKLKMIRKRAGILPGADELYGLRSGMTQAEMRTVIQLERAVELCYEDQRYFDVRRWKIAPQTMNVTMMRLRITKNADGSFSYQEVPVEKNPNHIFRDNHYFFPLPMNEIMKNPNLVQNPGY
ncbi:RagB/SusD family nutrient uptake outer membrane protein [Chitinophaga pendula]|uniref:RagB/SusD family nutrient uptake outer membrane protein n=1 Tax=Chitinophaga TaxID=79328 RepID=UPI000BB05511|nr:MULTISPECIES: RagB/SusD family nutrient uptake outer membrane protein [Chitinophaga]ASZ13994.1 RagB/SusD family nutrient uptake outer membrane protein [Chitinophaga sp. MD30]UCJ08382.1 RagB/SusD family nutrient uptake outer membrane protein [Chitinophaga pendula]